MDRGVQLKRVDRSSEIETSSSDIQKLELLNEMKRLAKKTDLNSIRNF